jgi:hypothetical protein
MAPRFRRQTGCTLALASNSMKRQRTVFIRVVALLLVASACGKETTTPLGAEWATWAMITGFHHAFDKRNQLEVRLLEADGSATVGLNPVSLYVVITNNSSAADLQQYVWLLPYRVRNVKSVKLVDSILQIRAEVDADPEASKSAPRELSVRYNISDGVLCNTLLVSERPTK